MKKFFASLFLFFLIPCICIAAGCNTLSNNDGWEEVQSITYTTDEGTTTLTSECVWNTTYNTIEQDEYASAPNEQKRYGYVPSKTTIDIDRSEFLDEANSRVGNIFYYTMNIPEADIQPWPYFKVAINSYTLNYVKIRFTSDKGIEFYEDDNTITKVYPISYKVTYFEN